VDERGDPAQEPVDVFLVVLVEGAAFHSPL
jgi:hypothetical protein